jgi:hypothetical protein
MLRLAYLCPTIIMVLSALASAVYFAYGEPRRVLGGGNRGDPDGYDLRGYSA